MSKIYDALHIAYGEKFASAKAEPKPEPKNEPIKASSVSVPSSSSLLQIKGACVIQRIYKESELMAMAQNITALFPYSNQNVIQFIGSRKGEGTSTLVREFALLSAQHSQTPVLLVEADLMQPSQYQAFGIEAKSPLDHVLKEGKPIDGVVSRVENSNLFLATLSSKIPSALTARTFYNPTDMWRIVREQFSLILIDSSPANVTADSLALCKTVDGTVLVVEAENTRSTVVKKVRDQILMKEGNLLGIVFTKHKLYIPEMLYKLL
jgi:Mrp family chromosome partitioning ATPase